MKLCTSIGTRLGALVRDFSAYFGYFTKWDRNYLNYEISWDHFEFSLLFTRGINRGYYMVAQRHEISLRVLTNISRVSSPFELSYDEFKVTKCCTKTFCLCWVFRSKIAVMCCVTSTFLNNYLGYVYIWACPPPPTPRSVWPPGISIFYIFALDSKFPGTGTL